MKRTMLLGLLLVSPAANATDVLLCYASTHNADVVNKLTATGLFNIVDDFDCQVGTPTAILLSGYDSVLVYSDFPFSNATLLGDRLADYVDTGGGVVEAVFANGTVSLTGRFANDGYEPITGTFHNSGFVLNMVIDDPSHPILDGVVSFNGGSSSYHTADAALGVGAVSQAHWDNGLVLVATIETFVGRTVGLNFYPPSSASQFDFWDQATDGDLLLANALVWAGERDQDGDGLLSNVDNCPDIANPLQEDVDVDGTGDVCDPCDDRFDPDTDGDLACDSFDACPTFDDRIDPDADAVPSGCDICPLASNPDQLDSDGDTVGDACDVCPSPEDPLDSDGDTVCDGVDACPGFNDAADPDGDEQPTACDTCPFVPDPDQLDSDGDTLGDECDNCPFPDDQVDSDGDSVCDGADACPGFDDALDPDVDEVPTGCDVCPFTADAAQLDSDGDSSGDACDICPLPGDPVDTDGDNVCDGVDACPGANDSLDPDSDGVPSACDLCPEDADPAQLDADGDDLGDVCDVCPTADDPQDDDLDGACDNADRCPGFDDREDLDSDGVPDDCDPCPFDTLDDSDGDGTCDIDDTCPGLDDYGPDQDYDTIADDCDNCLTDFNDDQRDFDGDGFGDECDCRVGHADDFPGAEETCDGEDEDCDGEVDEDAVDAVQYWVDADGDGQGNPNAAVLACEGGAELATNADDCDDGSAEARIGGTEVCNDGRDNDCDGITDPEELCPAEQTPTTSEEPAGCGCDQRGAAGPLGWVFAASLLGLRRRRHH